jgi:hypothetical protein
MKTDDLHLLAEKYQELYSEQQSEIYIPDELDKMAGIEPGQPVVPVNPTAPKKPVSNPAIAIGNAPGVLAAIAELLDPINGDKMVITAVRNKMMAINKAATSTEVTPAKSPGDPQI